MLSDRCFTTILDGFFLDISKEDRGARLSAVDE